MSQVDIYSKEEIVSVQDLYVSFTGINPFTAVRDLSFSIAKGKTLAIVGESGSGKSLTALALMGLLPKGAIGKGTMKMRNGEQKRFDLADTPCLEMLRGKDVAIVFQEPMSSLNPIMKVGQQIQEAITSNNNIPEKERKQLAIEWLRRVQMPQPEKIYHRYPHELSGGQKQRVMIAMAMCNHPALLIADEPTTALDATVQQEIISLMQYLQEDHQTAMIFITHDLALAAEIADEVLVMYKGEQVEYGIAKQVLTYPEHPYTKALLACKPSPENKGKRLQVIGEILENTMPVDEVSYAPSQVSNDTLLEVKNLKVWFPEKKNMLGATQRYYKAVDDVSFAIKKGETLGLVGESGSGKSTICRCLVGLLPIDGGKIVYNGRDITHISHAEWRGLRRKIQMVFQDPYSSLNPRMTVSDLLAEPLQVHGIVPQSEVSQEVKRLLNLVQLPEDAIKRYPHQFSGGQRQRIGIARALSLKPQLVICDESVSALDVSIQAQILNLLKDLQRELDLTYLFISHDMNVVYYMSDRVVVMKAGRIVIS